MKKKKFEHKPHHTMLFYSLVATPIALYQLLQIDSAYMQHAIAAVAVIAGMAFVVGVFKHWQHDEV